MGRDRESGRLMSAVAAGVLATVGWWLVFTRVEAAPSLALLAPAAGLFAALAVGVSLARGVRAAEGTTLLAIAAERQLDRLNLLERRILSLGDPWPQVVVGPTGVFVVALGADDPGGTSQEQDLAARRAGLSALVSGVEQRIGQPADAGGDRLSVLGVLVVGDRDAAAGAPAADPDVELVPVDRLATLLAAGPLASMAAVERATLQLVSGQLQASASSNASGDRQVG